MKMQYLLRVACMACVLTLPITVHANTAPVSGFAESFLLGIKVHNAQIKILETGETFKTDNEGRFGPFQYPVGKPITLQFSKWGYKTTQSATIIVPPEGLNSKFDNITFQVPSIESYYMLATIMGASIDKNSCHLTATVTKYHKTMEDLPQGEADVVVSLAPAVDVMPFYFGIYHSWPLKNKTNPFSKNLKQTSEDGGIAFFNIPASDKPYKLIGKKNGMKFTEATFLCRKDTFINISPPQGPMVLPGETKAS